jgi:hypothetical protein
MRKRVAETIIIASLPFLFRNWIIPSISDLKILNIQTAYSSS